LRDGLEAGDLHCRDSARFRSFDDDLVDDATFDRRSIACAHGGRFRARSQHEQEVWSECSRLVGNAVVYYNSLILSEVLAELESRGALTSAEILKRVSTVAWQHINFYGRYQFDADFTPIDFTQIRQQLSSEEVSRLYAAADR
jgi:hypothetical protein